MSRRAFVTRDAWIDGMIRIGVGLAAVLFIGAAVGLLRSTPAADAMASDGTAIGASVREQGTPDSLPRRLPRTLSRDAGQLASAAVARNPFSPRRRPPAQPYRLVRDDDLPADMTGPAIALEPPVVHGTAAAAGRAGFAMCAWGDAPTVVVRVGDVIGPFTVLGIARGRVTFRDPDGVRIVVETSGRSDGDSP